MSSHTPHDRLDRLERFCAAAGITTGTLGANAANNPRLFDRTRRRADALDRDLGRLEAYADESGITKPHGNATAHKQGEGAE